MSDSLLVFLGCGVPLLFVFGIAAIWTVRPQWIEKVAGEKRPPSKGRKR